MSSQYAGTATFPADFTIPDDGDPKDATSVNVALEALGDRSVYNKAALLAYIATNSPRIKVYTYTASGTFGPGGTQVPLGRVVAAFGIGCGGGGAGGRGLAGIATANRWGAGAGGGGGALLGIAPLILNPALLYNIDIGAGGATGGGTFGANGSDGGDTIIRQSSTNLAVFAGAQGGRTSYGGYSQSLWYHYVLGGLPVRHQASTVASQITIGLSDQNIRYDSSDAAWQTQSLILQMRAAQGGWGAHSSVATGLSGYGQRNPVGGFAGGSPGAAGANGDPTSPPGDTTHIGGGGGGGGGAGPFGVGANGGVGNAGQNNSVGCGGYSAAANTGAGGGGAGSDGCTISGFHALAGNQGGAGGSGRCYIITVEDQ